MDQAAELARRLADHAEAVCRHYLGAGRREGRYWRVGDIDNSPGRSLFVRLEDAAGQAGKWTDAATGEHGDLLDLIAAVRKLNGLRAALEEARAFLALPRPPAFDGSVPDRAAPGGSRSGRPTSALAGSPRAVARLLAASHPLIGTLAETYLRQRGITFLRGAGALRFHPACWYRPAQDEPQTRSAWPALIARVTDLADATTGLHRTWLDPSGQGKAAVATPRRALGRLAGQAVRLGPPGPVLVAGEGLETLLSVRQALPALPAAAALSAAHLASLDLDPAWVRLYIAVDRDPAGWRAAQRLAHRAQARGMEARVLQPRLADFNDDLQRFGPAGLTSILRRQLAPDDLRWAAAR